MGYAGRRIITGIVIGAVLLTLRVIANWLGVWDW